MAPLYLFLLASLFSTEGSRVVSVGAEAEALSAELGKPVSVSRELSANHVFISPGTGSPKDILYTLAASLHATVNERADAFQMMRTRTDRDSMHSARTADRKSWLLESIAREDHYRRTHWNQADPQKSFIDALDQSTKAVDEYSRGKTTTIPFGFPIYLLPSAMLTEGLCERIGFAKLASIPSGSVEVYEDQPMASAKPLPEHEDLVLKYLADMGGLGALKLSRNQQNKIKSRSNLESEAASEWNATDRTLARLRLEVHADSNRIFILFEGYDSAGKRKCINTISAKRGEVLRTGKSLLEDEARSPLLADSDAIFDLSTEELEARNFPHSVEA